MADFSRKIVNEDMIPKEDKGIAVQEIIELAQSNRFFDNLFDLLELDKISGEFVEIEGAKSLIRSLKKKDEEFVKFDLESHYLDMDFFYGEEEENKSKQFYISFTNITDEKAIDIVGNNEFVCTPEYSSKSDFFNSVYSMQKFASSLSDKGLSDFVRSTLYEIKDLIKKRNIKHKKFYRILKDKEGKFYLRASISERYNDYSDNIAVLLGLISLHKHFKQNGEKFYIKEFSYNESFVRVSFTKEKNRVIEGVGEVQYIIEVSNDEIKREALKFVSAVSIVYPTKDGKQDALYIKPSNEAKWTILSIGHGSTPTTLMSRLATLEDYVKKEEDMYKSLESISRIKNINLVRKVIQNRIDSSHNIKIGVKKQAINAELNAHVDHVYQLFDILNKVQHLVEDVEAKDYLRYLFFDILVKNRNPRSGTDDSIS